MTGARAGPRVVGSERFATSGPDPYAFFNTGIAKCPSTAPDPRSTARWISIPMTDPGSPMTDPGRPIRRRRSRP